MILLPDKEYSQGFLDELNYICHGFLDPIIDDLSGEEDEDFIAEELRTLFPGYLVYEDSGRCFDILKKLYEWLEDEYYHPITRLQEYVLAKAIQNQWIFFDDLPEENSRKSRNVFYALSGQNSLSKEEIEIIDAMKDDKLLSLQVLLNDIDFGELELMASFRQELPVTFLRF